MILRKSIAALLIAAFAIPSVVDAAERRREGVGDPSEVVIDGRGKENPAEKERVKRTKRPEQRESVREDKELAPEDNGRKTVREEKERAPEKRKRETAREDKEFAPEERRRETAREDKEYAPEGRRREIVREEIIREDKEYAPVDRQRESVVIREQVPSAVEIQRRLEAPATKRLRREERVTVREFTRRPELRRAAPSIDIQAINFAFASAEIPYSQYGKVEVIADAISRMLDRNPDAQVLIEGHTDAVGSFESNYRLSEARAASLRRLLVREFGIPSFALETVGYGEEYLLVNTPYEDWHNRRVTLRRIDEFVRQ